MTAGHQEKIRHARRRVYDILERGVVGDRTAALVGNLIVILIVVNLIAVALETVPRYAATYSTVFEFVEIVTLVVLTIEYLLRIWVAVEHPLYRQLGPLRARLRFMASAPGIIDLVAVLPFWLTLLFPAEFKLLLIFRVFRFLKLGRYSPAIRSLLDALYSERRALVGCFVILLGIALIVATLMYAIEGGVQPDKFGTIPDAMWWAIVTLGTIGYGDAVPVTALGRVLASGTILIGLIMIALPVGVIATAFVNVVHRRDFIVTWAMVARVPLFADLDARQIADIMQLLRSQRVDAGTTIARRGEVAHSMYFVADGEVEIAFKDESVRLGAGHFFGEVAILRKARRSANVTAKARTSLLVLDARDVHMLMEREPEFAERLHRAARERVGRGVFDTKGDILAEELDSYESSEIEQE